MNEKDENAYVLFFCSGIFFCIVGIGLALTFNPVSGFFLIIASIVCWVVVRQTDSYWKRQKLK